MSTVEPQVKGFLSPVERFSEILFGLIMTLSIMGTLSVVTGGREEVLTTILSILGCNIAWGIIDAILYLLGVVSERGRAYALYNFVRKTGDVEKARAVIGEALPGIIADGLSPGELENMRERITRLPKPAHRTFVTSHDLGGALGVCILVVLSCFPLIIPLLLIQDTWRALRVSNGVAIIMLFLGGYFLAKYAGLPKILTGVVMVTLGVVMVGITIALGG